MATLNDFSVLHTRVTKYMNDLNLQPHSAAFPYVAMEIILGLSINEIQNSIVDGGQDRGLDAVYIVDEEGDVVIHLFQFKYTSAPQKINHNFPGGEIDKVLTIIDDILSLKEDLQKEINPQLWSKVQDIQSVFMNTTLPKIIIHFCGNQQELTSSDKDRITRSVRKYVNVFVECDTIDSLVNSLIAKRSKKIDGRLHFVDFQYFDRSDGNVKAVIATVSALELVKLIESSDYPGTVQEDVFEDNIRIYQRNNKINDAILNSALDEQNYEFFYLNNGITMTCEKISYMPTRHPLVELENIQIVNGSQTSHALFEAYKKVEDKSLLERVLVLLRIYQIGNSDIASRIVATTNSQTPIFSRDIRANDPIQKRLEVELFDKGYYYERKKNYYQDKDRTKRLDSELVGQVLMSYYLSRPHEVKGQRRLIFSAYYDMLFHPNINADIILEPFAIFQYIEEQKVSFQKFVKQNMYDPRRLYLPHASFHMLYGIKILSDIHGKDVIGSDFGRVKEYYTIVADTIADIVERYQEQRGKKYSHNYFFREKRVIEIIEREIKMRA